MPGLVGAAATGMMSARYVVGKKNNVTKRRIFLGLCLGFISLFFIIVPLVVNKLWSWHLMNLQMGAFKDALKEGRNSTTILALLNSILSSDEASD